MINCLHPVMILAGGLATRLRPLTEKIPKSLILIKEEPFIYHQLRLLSQQQIKNVVLCLGYLGHLIEEKVGDGRQFNLNIHYSYDGEQQLGTAGSIKKALPLVDEHFFVLYGDSYLPCDFSAIQRHYQAKQKLALMTIYKNNNQGDTSNIEYKTDRIIAYNKKNPTEQMQHIDYGLGIFHRNAFNQVPTETTYDLATLYQQLLKQQQLSAFEVYQRFYEIGSYRGIEELTNYL